MNYPLYILNPEKTTIVVSRQKIASPQNPLELNE